MNKITDFKSHKNFNHGGPKFSLCLESSGLTCQIPNLYKTFCDGSTDPTKNSQLNIDIGHIKSYLIGTLSRSNPYDVIINNYGSIVSSEFKKDFDQRNYIVSNAKLESLGWKADNTIDDGIIELINGYNIIAKFKNKDFTNL